MQFIKYPKPSEWTALLTRPVFETSEIEKRVRPILEAIKTQGDKALREFNLKFDKTAVENLEVTAQEITEAEQLVSEELKEAILTAKANIEKFHLAQKEDFPPIETMQGVKCWRKSVPIQKVGLYIPGGTASLFSTVLMLGIPAKIAGCAEIVLCSPPNAEGKIHPTILFTAKAVGVTKIIKAGGAQAVGAMAYGTESVPKVCKIFGPGNQYVTAAKQLVNQGGTAIDMPAGSSEVAVLADESANPAFVASDLLSQAEHGADSQVILVSTNQEIIEKSLEEVNRQLENLPRKELARQAIQHSKSILVDSEETAYAMLNEYAPEHLILAVAHPEIPAEKITEAGSVFMGHFTPESAGDYASGTNHTLPTNGFAKVSAGVSLDSFIKKITYQQITPEGLETIGKTIEIMAEAEELFAHKNAVTLRLKALNK